MTSYTELHNYIYLNTDSQFNDWELLVEIDGEVHEVEIGEVDEENDEIILKVVN